MLQLHKVERDRSEILLEVIASMTRAPRVEVALQRLAELALRASGGDRCAILTRDVTDGQRLIPAAAATQHGDPEDMWERFRDMEAVRMDASAERRLLLETDAVIAIEDVRTSRVIPPSWHQEWGSRSAVLAPLRVEGRTFGVLAIDHLDHHRFVEDELQLVRSIASAASLALRDAELLEQVRQRAVLEHQLAGCMAVLLAGGQAGDVLARLADAFEALMPEVSFSINVVAADRRSFRTVAWRGSEPIQSTFSFEELPAADIQMIRNTWRDDPHKPIAVLDLRERTRWRPFIPHGFDAAMLVPLTAGEQVIGWIAAGRHGLPFSDDEIRVARVFAGQAAISVDQARLRDRVDARAKVIESLFLLGDRAGRRSDPKRLIRELNQELATGLGLRCSRLVVGRESLARALRLPAADAVERELLKGWRERAEPHVQERRIAVPVRVNDRVAGVLWIDALTAPDPMMLSVAAAIGSAIGDVVAKAKLRRRSERRAVDLALARERERIAEDLHDTVGQIFYSIGLRVHDAAMRMQDPAMREALLTVRSHAATGMHEVRAAVYAASNLHMERAGLAAGVSETARRFSLATGVAVDTQIDEPLGRISRATTQALSRIVHEIFNNIERHARARIVALSLWVADKHVHLTVRDDGVGLAQRADASWREPASFGLRSMERTVRRLSGTFEIRASRPTGLELRVSLPVNGTEA